MDSSKTIGIFYSSDGTDRSLVVAMWWRTLVIRNDKGDEEPFFVWHMRTSFALCGVRVLWRK